MNSLEGDRRKAAVVIIAVLLVTTPVTAIDLPEPHVKETEREPTKPPIDPGGTAKRADLPHNVTSKLETAPLKSTSSKPAFTVKQGRQTYSIKAFNNGQSVVDFYNYYNAESHTPANLEQEDVSLVFPWKGPNGTSLVIVHDAPNDNEGGDVTFDFVNLSNSGEWIVRDDNPGNDYYRENQVEWHWGGAHTDGGAYNGPLNNVTIKPNFHNGIDKWVLLGGNLSNPTTHTLDKGQSITIQKGLSADMKSPPDRVQVGKTVTFDASPSINSDGKIVSYEWDLNGDGRVDKTGERVNYQFTRAGTQTVMLQVTGSEGKTAKTTESVTVLPENVSSFGEVGQVTVSADTNEWQTVNLNQSYSDPVVVAWPLSNNGPDSAHTRIRNASGGSFDIQVEEWPTYNGAHGNETVSYLVVEKGVHTLSNGVKINAGTTEAGTKWRSTNLDGWSTSQTPVLLTQTQTVHESDPVVTRTQSVNGSGFEVLLQEGGTDDGNHPEERVGYIALESGQGSNYGMKFEIGGQTVEDFYSSHIGFSSHFDSPPAFLAKIQTGNGMNTVNLRYQGLTQNDVDIEIQEPDNDGGHAMETAGWAAFENSGKLYNGTIAASNSDLSVNFSAVPREPSVGTATVFDATVKAPGTSVTSYKWTFTDGTIATGDSVFHTFREAGNFTATLMVTTADGRQRTLSKTVSVGNTTQANVSVDRVLPSKQGAALEGVQLNNTYVATVTGTESVDHVNFSVGGKTYTDSDGSDGWQQQINLGLLEGDSNLKVTAVGVDGSTDTYVAHLNVIGVPNWLEALADAGNVTVKGGKVTIAKQVPREPIDISEKIPKSIPVVGGKQAVYASAKFGVTYVMPDGTAVVMGQGTLSATIAQRDAKGQLGARGTIATKNWDLQKAEVWVYVEVEAWSTTWKVSVPVVKQGIGIDVGVSPHVRMEVNMDENSSKMYVKGGKTTIGVKANGSTSGTFGPAEVRVGTTGNTQITGHAPPPLKPGGKASIRASATASMLAWSNTYTIGPIEYAVGSSAQTLTTLSDAEVNGSGWQLRDKRSITPFVRSGGNDLGVRLLGTTDPSQSTLAYGRITEDGLEDKSPSLTAWGSANYTLVWDRQHPNKTVAEGHDIYVSSQSNESSWSTPMQLSDDRTYEFNPSIASSPNGEKKVAVWTRTDIVIPEANISSPAQAYDALEIVYAVYENGSWSASTELTSDSVMDYNPEVAYQNGSWLIGWTSDTDANITTVDDHQVRYAEYDEQMGAVQSINDATHATVGATDGGFSIGYLAPKNGSVTSGSVVHLIYQDGSLGIAGTYATSNLTDLQVDKGKIVWVDGLASDPSVHYAGLQSAETVPVKNISDIRNVNLISNGKFDVLTYRGRPAGQQERELFYTVRHNGSWVYNRSLAGSKGSNLSLWQAAYATHKQEFAAVFMGRNESTDQKHDLFYVEHGYLGDLTVNATMGNVSAVGDNTSVNYTVRNIGDLGIDGNVTVSLYTGGQLLASRNVSGMNVSEHVSGALNATVGETGSLTVRVDPADGVHELSETNNDAVLTSLYPDLTVANVSQYRSGGSAVVNATLVNTRSVTATNVTYAIERNRSVIVNETVGTIRGGQQRQVRLVFNATSVDRSFQSTVRVDPSGQVAEADETNNAVTKRLFRPNLGLTNGAVQFYDVSEGTLARVVIANGGIGNAETNISIRSENGSLLAMRNVTISGAAVTSQKSYQTVLFPLSNISLNETVYVTLQTDHDSDSTDNALAAEVNPIYEPSAVGEDELGTPTIDTTTSIEARPNTTISIPAAAKDPDGQVETFEVVYPNGSVRTIDPAGSTIELPVSNTTWNATTGQYEEINLTVRVVDDYGVKEEKTISVKVYLPGDTTRDGMVDIYDAVTVSQSWQTKQRDLAYREVADLNNDGVVNIFDAVIVGRNWEETAT